MGQINLFKKSFVFISPEEILRRVVAKVQGCDIVESEFELQLYYYFHFRINTSRKVMNSRIPPTDTGFILFTKPLRPGRIWHKVNF